MPQPLHLVAVLVVVEPETQPVGQLGKDGKIVAGLAIRRDHLMHGDPEFAIIGGTDVVAFHRGRRGKNNVGEPGGRSPPRLMHDHGGRLLPSLQEPVQVGIMVERVSPGRVDQLYLRQRYDPTVVLKLTTGIEQQVRYPAHWYLDRDRVPTERQGRAWDACWIGEHDTTHCAKAEAEPSPGQADLTQHARQCHSHPDWLFPMVGTLNRPTRIDERPRSGHAPGKLHDDLRWDTGDMGRPHRIPGQVVGVSEQVTLELRIANAVAIQKFPIVQAVRHQRVSQTQHQGGVGVWSDRHPFRRDPVGHVRAYRAHTNNLNPCPGGPGEPVRIIMVDRATGVDLRVLQGRAAEQHQQAGMVHHIGPAHDQLIDIRASEDVRHGPQRCPEAMIPYLVYISAEEGQEPFEHTRGVV
ncbi:MAG TPA: hypothetical protein VL485_19720 [Ktedonobacteraceae bacterium]|nr:hypothetical protein [Ktedonobacteraceae bacterium]